MGIRHRRRIVIIVITRGDVYRFVACDILFSMLTLKSLQSLSLPFFIPIAGSIAAPMLLKRTLDRF